VAEEVARMMMAAAAAADAALSLGDTLAPMWEWRLQKSCDRWSAGQRWMGCGDDACVREDVKEGWAPAGGGRR
jgi:hypothetical protein